MPFRARLGLSHLWLLLPFLGAAWRSGLPLDDNSFLWHVRAGSVQLAAGDVLRSDPFSFTMRGEPWRTQSWLIELGYGWGEDVAGGLGWVPTMLAVLFGLVLVFCGLAVYKRTGSPRHTAVALGVVAWTGTFFLVPRPVLAFYVFLAALWVVLQHRRRLGWTLVPLLWIWAAVHGSFAIGIGLLAIEAIRAKDWWLARLAVVAALATTLTAHGSGAWLTLIQFYRSSEALGFLSEWGPPDFSNAQLWGYLLVLGGVVIARAQGRIPWRDLMLIVPVAAFGLAQERSLFPALIVLLPWAVEAVPKGRVRRSGDGIPALNLALAAGLVVLVVLALTRPLRLDETVLPPPAAVASLDPGGVFHGPAAGGWLIYAEWPERLVFVDDRAELYGAEFFAATVAAIEGSGHVDLFDQHGIDQVLGRTSWALIDKLTADGWAARYRDEEWVVVGAP